MHASQQIAPGRVRYHCPACGRRTRGNDHPLRDRTGRLLTRVCDTPSCTSSRAAVHAYQTARRNHAITT